MREFIQILEAEDQTVTLYRGDAEEIARFERAKTDMRALFGRGIYLTDSAEIAADYTIKSNDKMIFQGGMRFPTKDGYYPQFKSKTELVSGYLHHILNVDLGFDKIEADLKTEYQQRFWKTGTSYGSPEYKEASDKITKEWREARTKAIRQFVEKAKRIYRERQPGMRIAKMTTGDYAFVSMDRGGSISSFEVPVSYLSRCLHGETPMSDEVLVVMKKAFLHAMPHGDKGMDLRFDDPKDQMTTVNTWDNFIEGYKKYGSRYAWRETRHGGDGKNPSLDFVLNGQHSGYAVWERSGDFMIDEFMKMGHTGIVYQGGMRVGSDINRGGGGYLHNAYVLWDDEAVNSFRRDSRPAVDDDTSPDDVKGLRASRVAGL